MRRWDSQVVRRIGLAGVVGLALAAGAKAQDEPAGQAAKPRVAQQQATEFEEIARAAQRQAQILAGRAAHWYRTTPPTDRMTWGGLIACAVLGGSVLVERTARLRRGKVAPKRFIDRWLERMEEGLIDRAKALDLCELNPSPASRIALAALRRWGRPVADLERAVALARQVEVERLGRGLGTLRRVAALAPLIGLLGSLLAAGRALEGAGDAFAWGPALGNALAPLTAGVALSILSLLAFDGLTGRLEKLMVDLDRLGAGTIDAISLAAPAPVAAPAPRRAPAHVEMEVPIGPRHGLGRGEPSPSNSPRGPHFRPMGVPSRSRAYVDRDELPEDLREV
jgi:biopolymer transport protein ExbB